MKRPVHLGTLLLAFGLGIGPGASHALARAQEPGASDPYRQALTHFREGRHARAVDILETALEGGRLGGNRASAWLLLAAANLGLDAPQPALNALDGLEREYPEGPYLLERQWLRGRAQVRSGRYLEAARIYAGLYEADPEGRLGTVARDALAALVAGPMPPGDLQRLGAELTGTDLKAWIVAVAAEAMAEGGDPARARRLLERIESEAPPGGYGALAAQRLATLADQLRSMGPAGFVLGVLVPLTGPDAALGKEIVDAVRLAIGSEGSDVRYVLRDTGGRLEGTVRGMLSLIEDEGAHMIIGPVVEELAVVAAGMAEGMGVPIILPHTQGAVAPSLGSNVFQLQATPRIQAEALADVVVDSLGMLTFAVLNSVAGSGPAFAEAFIARAEEKGGNVIAHQQYYPGTTDFTDQLTAIRRQALTLSLADTSDVAVDDLETIAAADRDTTGALVPVGSLDALVVPGSNAEDTAFIALQADFIYLVTTILGGPAWNSYSVVGSGGGYVDGTIFTDTYSIGQTSMRQIDFANRFYAAYHRQPGRTATFTYDAVRLALNAWQLAADRRQDRRRALREWLAGVESFEGASGPVNLTRRQRVNDNVYMLQIRGDMIQPLEIAARPAAIPPRPRDR